MLRKLALSLAVSAALGASQVNALGLGAIQVNSALNEPLDAEIALTQVRDLSPLQIQPRMASLDEYSTASGGSQARYLRDIQFQVLVSPDGKGRIRLKSSEPVQEPFLNFMVEVNWPSGRMVREYTLLLDPPVFEPTPVGSTRSISRVQTRDFASAEPAAPLQPRATTTGSARAATTGGGKVSVGAKDTLWDIAKRNKPAGTTEHQMMLALLRKNPQAFLTGNINNLKAGSSMTIPSADEVNRLTHREAVAEVARQMELWRNRGRPSTSEDSPAPLNVSKAPEAEASATGEKNTNATAETAAKPAADVAGDDTKLTVVAPVEESADKPDSTRVSSIDSDDTATTGNKDDREQVVSATAERLENEVLMAQEQIDRLERDNADLNDKLSSVLEQLESQSRLLELQSQQMSTLQDELSRKPAAAPAAAASSESLLQNPLVLGGLGAGALALLGSLLFALRRKRGDQPEAKRELVTVPDDLRDEKQEEASDAPVNVASAAAVGAAAVAGAALADETEKPSADARSVPEDESEEFVRPPMSSLASTEDEQASISADEADDLSDLDQDLQELDLDMDLDLDDLSSDAESTESGIDSAEFDLGADDEAEQDLLSESGLDELVDGVDLDAEDDALEFSVKQPADEAPSEPDSMLAGDDDADDLDFLLDSNTDEVASGDADDSVEELLGDLDFPTSFEAESEAAAEATEAADGDDRTDNSLHETVETAGELEFEVDPELEAMLQGSSGTDDDELFSAGQADDSAAETDLDSLLASFDPVDEDDTRTGITPLSGEEAQEELAANISHDLEMDLDAEVDELLDSTDDEIELDEQSNDEQDDILDRMNLLSDADEIETKLDLARAYIEMEDDEGARDILNEITGEGSEDQRAEARKLLETLG